MHPVALERQETLFERCWWFYALCREYVFTDHTEEIAAALAPLLRASKKRHLLEVGCGPGFYARRFASCSMRSRGKAFVSGVTRATCVLSARSRHEPLPHPLAVARGRGISWQVCACGDGQGSGAR